MFQDLQDVIAHVGKESKESISRLTKNNSNGGNPRRSSCAGEGEEKDDEAQEWRVNLLPTDDLDKLMWGSGGIPPPASPGPSKYSKNWSRRRRRSYENNNNGETVAVRAHVTVQYTTIRYSTIKVEYSWA